MNNNNNLNQISTMHVIKRNGSKQDISFDKIIARIRKLCYGFNSSLISPERIAQKVISGMYDGVTTTELDCLAAEITAYSSTIHPDFSVLAARIAISNLHKNTEKSFSENITKFYNYIHPQTKKMTPLVSEEIYNIVMKYKEKLDAVIIHDRDFYYDYFGFKTLEKSYLIKMDGIVQERPQHMHMRVALGIHKDNIEKAIETYNLISQKYFTHATPTLYNAGTVRPQLSSCFLLSLEDDSIQGIYSTLQKCALISKYAGGIGLSIHNVRAKDSFIAGTNGISNGIVPMLKVFNDTARYVDQCFVEDTPVYTLNECKKIQDICQTDKVLTHNGSYCKIENIRSYNHDDQVVNIECNGFRKITQVTSQHPVLVLNKHNKLTTTYVDAGELTVNNYLAFPIPEDLPDLNIYTDDDCYFYGYFMYYGTEVNNNQISLHEKYFSPKVQNYIDTNFTYEKEDEYYIITSYKLVTIKYQLLQLSNCKLSNLIKAMCEQCSYDHSMSIRETRLYIKPQDIDILQYILLKLAIYNYVDGDQLCIPHTQEFKTLCPDSVHMLNMDTSYIIKDRVMYVKISNVSRSHYNGKVYDFDICTNHNYVTTAGTVHNGGGKRKGSFAIYLEPWHADIFEFLDLKKQTGNEDLRAKDLFYAMWIPDLFMKRVQQDANWSLFCPHEAPNLYETHSDEFDKLYMKYEKDSKLVRKVVKARDIWTKILESQIETGTPYILYKDQCNKKSNQQNLGTIRSSNLCTEIVEFTSSDEIAVCNLASINLQKFVNDDQTYDFAMLHKVTKVITRNLNKIIDVNYYPVPEAEHSNKKHRPIGIGVQGLADTFMRMRYPFESSNAKQLNKDIFETIYHAAMETSIEIAKEDGPYSTYDGSPLSKGILQFDMWNVTPSERWDWSEIKKNLATYGARNSLLLAPMPTASTAQILGNNESIEPFTTNIYTRRVLAGEFTIINRYLLEDLIDIELWNDDMKNRIIADEGSIQKIDEIPQNLKDLYKTVWEIKQKAIIDMAADRGAYICQSQSMNIHLESPTISQLTSCHFYSWKKGLKTGCYYLRARPKTNAIQFTVDKSKIKKDKPKLEVCMPGCDSCGA